MSVNRYDALRLAIQWAEDIQKGEFITANNYQRNYLGFSRITDHDLSLALRRHEHRTFTYDMGELIPLRRTT